MICDFKKAVSKAGECKSYIAERAAEALRGNGAISEPVLKALDLERYMRSLRPKSECACSS